MSELTVQYLVLERCDPARNMARFYVLTIEPTLFGDTALVREWGRLGQRGRRRLDLLRGGYRPSRHSRLGSCAKHVVATSGEFRRMSEKARCLSTFGFESGLRGRSHGEGQGTQVVSTDYPTFRSGSTEFADNGGSRLGIYDMVVPAMACRSRP
ncbi:WGR domain-containing protein [Bradyrhizobium jicamae]|uniref:WGR domain-containing protein n=1 Tax=Bradyrhizobium jicamae TaxID=280332 RepID=UPI003D9B5562